MNLLINKCDYIIETGFKQFTGGVTLTNFEKLLSENSLSVERFVKFRISNVIDAEDVLQEIYLTSFKKFNQLKNVENFKAWIIGIARNKCNDYFRKKYRALEIPIEEINETQFLQTRYGYVENHAVTDTLNYLKGKDKQILYLFYLEDLPQKVIAQQLNIPIGTVKSRLSAARQNFKNEYAKKHNRKVETIMNKLPDTLPDYKITTLLNSSFNVKCEELLGLSIIPKLGEKVTWGLYDFKTRKCEEYSEVSVIGKAEVHGIEGVEIKSIQHDLKNSSTNNRTFVAQLTNTHCRYLSETHIEKDIKKTITFLDGEIFMDNWGFGKENLGAEIQMKPKGILKRIENEITKTSEEEIIDIVGYYKIKICGKVFDTVCVMDIGHFNNAIAIEQFIDKNGRTVLWRRFNRDDWAIDHYKKKWSEILPNNDTIIINGNTYVHWYDCITDYIL